MATKAQILAILEGIDSATEVKFRSVGAIPAATDCVIGTTAHIQDGEIDRSVAGGGGDTVTVNPMVFLIQG